MAALTLRGTRPSLEICERLTGCLGVPREDVLCMAGHMTPGPSPTWPPELVALVREVEGPAHAMRRAVPCWQAS